MFDDLVPQKKGAFDDLVPSKGGRFDDLVPKKGVAQGDPKSREETSHGTVNPTRQALSTPNAPPAQRQMSYAEDITKSVGSSLARGVMSIPGMLGDIPELGRQGVEWGLQHTVSPIVRALGGKVAESTKPAFQLPTTSDIEGYAQSKGLPVHTPQTTPGKYFGAIAQVVPLVAMGPQSVARKALQAGFIGAGSQAGADIGGTPGALLGGVAGAIAGSGVSNTVRTVRDLRGRQVPVEPAVTHAEQVGQLADDLYSTRTAAQADMIEMRQRGDAMAAQMPPVPAPPKQPSKITAWLRAATVPSSKPRPPGRKCRRKPRRLFKSVYTHSGSATLRSRSTLPSGSFGTHTSRH